VKRPCVSSNLKNKGMHGDIYIILLPFKVLYFIQTGLLTTNNAMSA